MNLSGKIAIVTGGGGAIGQAVCNRLAADGAVVFVADINLANAQKAVDKITALGGLSREALDKRGVISVGNKADILAILARRHGKALLGGNGACLRLGKLS